MACQAELPSAPGFVFGGNPIDYSKFIQDFKARVDDRPLSDGSKFAQLVLATTEEVKQTVQLFRGTTAGYSQALVALKERFGQPVRIVTAHLQRIQSTKRIASHESERLLEFSDRLNADRDIFSELGYLDEANCQANLKIVFDKLPARVQARWAESCMDEEAMGRRPTFSAMVTFIQRQAKRSNHPLFTVERDAPTNVESQSKRQPTLHFPRETTMPTDVDENQHYDTSGPTGISSQQYANPTRSQPTYQDSQYTPSYGTGKDVCEYCTKNHRIVQCSAFAGKTAEERKQFVMDRRLCFCCLGPHQARICPDRARCQVRDCEGIHHWLIHTNRSPPVRRFEQAPRPQATSVNGNTNSAQAQPEVNRSTQQRNPSPSVLLRVVPIAVAAGGNRWISTYGLLDSGSTCTFVTKELAAATNMKVMAEKPISITTLLSSTITEMQLSECEIGSILNGDVRMKVAKVHITEALGIGDQYTPALAEQTDVALYRHLTDLWNVPFKVDLPRVSILVGNDVPMAHSITETRYGPDPNNQPYGVKTPFGWCIAGPTGKRSKERLESAMHTTREEHLEEMAEKWWSEKRHGFTSDNGKTLSINQNKMADKENFEDKKPVENPEAMDRAEATVSVSEDEGGGSPNSPGSPAFSAGPDEPPSPSEPSATPPQPDDEPQALSPEPDDEPQAMSPEPDDEPQAMSPEPFQRPVPEDEPSQPEQDALRVFWWGMVWTDHPKRTK